jgi:hypothetical protein
MWVPLQRSQHFKCGMLLQYAFHLIFATIDSVKVGLVIRTDATLTPGSLLVSIVCALGNGAGFVCRTDQPCVNTAGACIGQPTAQDVCSVLCNADYVHCVGSMSEVHQHVQHACRMCIVFCLDRSYRQAPCVMHAASCSAVPLACSADALHISQMERSCSTLVAL